MAHTQHDRQRNGNVQPKPGSPRPPLAAVLPEKPSRVAEHAREIMLELIRWRQNYKAEGVAEEAFKLARAFASEEAKEINQAQPGAAKDG